MSINNYATLTQVESGSPMGLMLRRYWQPVLLSKELPENDGPPVRVRLLGEDLLAFRTTSGQIGLVGNHCPHRGASLFFGRNEGEGLRCIYHGWKFDINGSCVDMPNEPSNSAFQSRIRHTAYPCEEIGGFIWAYMGPPALKPPTPRFEWLTAPEGHLYVSKHTQDCNWLQALEGDMDSSHVGFLHGTLHQRVPGIATAEGPARKYLAEGLQPTLEVVQTEFGILVGSRRAISEEKNYWRVTAYLMPYYAMIPPTGDAPLRVNIWQPVDNENSIVWRIDYHPARPLTEVELQDFRSGEFAHVAPDEFQPATTAPGGRWRPMADKTNDYLIDRKAQETDSYSGLKGFWLQDRVVTESMGPIYDRSRENLRSSDAGVVQLRRLLARTVDDVQGGKAPPALDPATHQARAVAMELSRNAEWKASVPKGVLARTTWQTSP
jgi:phenylpropionate dioxygenase-like ring-hydroxylating dioxygenase large terminal subunit